MRKFCVMLAALALAGCDALDTQRPPVTPVTSAPVPPKVDGSYVATIWVMVVDPTGACIKNATVQVVSGQGIGRSVVQDASCTVWDYGGGVFLNDLTPGVAMTIRATAPSGQVQEKTVVPFYGSFGATIFDLQ